MVRAVSTPGAPGGSAGRVGVELLVLVLVLASLGGSLALVVSMYRRPPAPPAGPEPKGVPVPWPVIARSAEPEVASPVAIPVPAVEPDPTTDDPTPKVLADLAAGLREQREAAGAADRRTASLRDAKQKADAAADARERATMVLRTQAQALERQAELQELDAETSALELDMLARDNEKKRAELARAQARSKSSYALQPYKGPNGTWRCPVVLDCRDGEVSLPPRGPSFTMMDLEQGGIGTRAFLLAVNRAAAAASKLSAPDGADVVPYVLFVVRPDGIRPYYTSRTLLESLGVPFGYELVAQETEIDYPDLGDPAEWPEAEPLGNGVVPTPARTRPTQPARGGSGAGYALSPDNPRPPTHHVTADRLFNGEEDGRGGGPGGEDGGRAPRVSGLATRGATGLGADRQDGVGLGNGNGNAPMPGGNGGNPRALSPLPGMPRPGYVPRGRELDALGRSGPWGTPPPPDFKELERALGAAGAADGDLLADLAGDRLGLDGGKPEAGAARRGGAGSPGMTAQPGTNSPRGANPSGLAGNAGGAARSAAPTGGSGGGQGRVGNGAGSPTRSPVVDTPKERDLELVVVCSKEGVILHPGAYRLSAATLKASTSRLCDDLKKLVRAQEVRDPDHAIRPKLRFLVQPGGHATYELARGQTLLQGIDWPSRLQVAEGETLRLADREAR